MVTRPVSSIPDVVSPVPCTVVQQFVCSCVPHSSVDVSCHLVCQLAVVALTSSKLAHSSFARWRIEQPPFGIPSQRCICESTIFSVDYLVYVCVYKNGVTMHTLPRLRDRLNEYELNHQRQVRVAISSPVAGNEYYYDKLN